MTRYEKVKFLGSGTYGEVWQCLDKQNSSNVAVKTIKVINEGEGINFTALREIMLLQELKHNNIISLYDVFLKNSNVHLVLELAEFDLSEKIPSLQNTEDIVKGLLKQLLQGLAFMHENSVIHRDLKPGNLLISRKGELKITDFGTAKIVCDAEGPRSSGICSLWYQAPELLFGTKHYGKAMDIWSVGCIFAELLNKKTLFNGQTCIDQLTKIFNTLGTPDDVEWPGVNYLPTYMAFAPSPKISFSKAFPNTSEAARDLLQKMLAFCPSSRIPASEALDHEYFTTGLPPASYSEISRVIV
jgi:serine/threonine protein kinase